MRRMARTVRLLAPSNLNVLVCGETGTGKELVSRALHLLSPRTGGPFVALNCGAIPGELIESELFGHERGAFTGAMEVHPGIFEQADGGTLLLDELAELPLDQQPRLLRVLETGRVRRVGSKVVRPVDVRVVAATHVDLAAAVTAGRFRRDLFYRVNEAEVKVPSLAERRADIPLLLERFGAELPGGAAPPEPATFARLQTRRYPGNVRELRSLVRRAAVLGWTELDEPTFPEPEPCAPGARVTLPAAVAAAEAQRKYPSTTYAEIEQRILERALEEARGNKARAARMLGMAKSTFNDRLRRLHRRSRR
jgi:DNA-binding NtrC family response regulator